MRRINRTAGIRKVAQKRRHNISRAKRVKRIFNDLFHRTNEIPCAAVSER